MDVLTVALALLVAIAILFEVARRLGVPYPTLFVVGGLGLALIPGVMVVPDRAIERALAVVAHPDDVDFWAGGTVAGSGENELMTPCSHRHEGRPRR